MGATYQVPENLFKEVLAMLTWAVHEHYNCKGTDRKPRSDSGWEDSYRLMEEMEAVRDA